MGTSRRVTRGSEGQKRYNTSDIELQVKKHRGRESRGQEMRKTMYGGWVQAGLGNHELGSVRIWKEQGVSDWMVGASFPLSATCSMQRDGERAAGSKGKKDGINDREPLGLRKITGRNSVIPVAQHMAWTDAWR